MIPTERTTDSIGTVAALSSRLTTIDALAKPPGRSWPSGLGTVVSTWNVRLVVSTEGLIRATLPRKVRVAVRGDRDPHVLADLDLVGELLWDVRPEP